MLTGATLTRATLPWASLARANVAGYKQHHRHLLHMMVTERNPLFLVQFNCTRMHLSADVLEHVR